MPDVTDFVRSGDEKVACRRVDTDGGKPYG